MHIGDGGGILFIQNICMYMYVFNQENNKNMNIFVNVILT